MPYSLPQIVEPLKSYVQQGAEPKILARSTAVGLVIGIVPLIGKFRTQTPQHIETFQTVSRPRIAPLYSQILLLDSKMHSHCPVR